jgi:hypothetical protein
VTQYGEPTMMILPYGMAQEALRLYASQKMIKLMDTMPLANAGAPELSLEDINALVHELRG